MSAEHTHGPSATEAVASVAISEGHNQCVLYTQLQPTIPRPDHHIVTICAREEALSNSKAAAQLLPHLPPYELSFWTDASLPGAHLTTKAKSATQRARALAGFCVVHRRWNMRTLQPGDVFWGSTWWLSGFVAPNIASAWQAEALGIIQALKMAIDRCEQVSGITFTTKRCKPYGKRITSPMPTLVNVFSDNAKVLQSFGGLSNPNPNQFPKDIWLTKIANELIRDLSKYNVRVRLQWIPGHSGDKWNAWAHEGARLATKRRTYSPRVYRKELHRVMLVPRRDRYSQLDILLALIDDTAATPDALD